MLANIGIIGIGVMGENLALNFESKGFSVAVYDIDMEKIKRFINGRAKGKKIVGTFSYYEFVSKIEQPRKILMMVNAGKPVDAVIEAAIPLLDKGDILIDGGNSHFADTNRRVNYLLEKGVYFVGSGVSGGEEGALNGPALMPGGPAEAWEPIKPAFQAIAAKVDGVPCCDWIGEEGSGHFIKMVHNGIEYGDMQLICESYQFMKDVLDLNHDEMHQVFAEWNDGELKSYLIEITRDILAFKDTDGSPLVEKILDKAGQKGTGKWKVITALDQGTPLSLVSEAVFARYLSAQKDERVLASKALKGPSRSFSGDKQEFIVELRRSLYLAKVLSYAQGYSLMGAAAKEFKWKLNYGGIAMIWRGGCIIRSDFLQKIKEAYDRNPNLHHLLFDPFFGQLANEYQQSLRRIVMEAMKHGVSIPCFASALTYYDGYRSAHLPANLLQAQRDYFGAHQYQRVDRPEEEFFHTNWTGHGGETASTVYNA
jgi:6-phosphogluconate dehydrogenase